MTGNVQKMIDRGHIIVGSDGIVTVTEAGLAAERDLAPITAKRVLKILKENSDAVFVGNLLFSRDGRKLGPKRATIEELAERGWAVIDDRGLVKITRYGRLQIEATVAVKLLPDEWQGVLDARNRYQ